MAYQLPLAYNKRNCTWPLRSEGGGWVTARLLDRFDAAVRHFMRTPKGTLYSDPNYGTEIYELRGQIISDGEAQIQEVAIQSGFRTYLPDLQLMGIRFQMDGEDEHLYVHTGWKVRTAIESFHGALAKPQTTQVMY